MSQLEQITLSKYGTLNNHRAMSKEIEKDNLKIIQRLKAVVDQREATLEVLKSKCTDGLNTKMTVLPPSPMHVVDQSWRDRYYMACGKFGVSPNSQVIKALMRSDTGELNISNSMIGTEGWRALAYMLWNHEGYHGVNISGCNLHSEALDVLSELMERNHYIRYYVFESNNMGGDQGYAKLKKLADLLPHIDYLQR